MHKILKLFIFWRLGLLVVTYLGSQAIPLVANGGLGAIANFKSFNYWLSWAQWDGGHFYQISKNGYQMFTDYAFFPLYPFLVATASKFPFLDLLSAGLLISNTAFILFLLVFFKAIKEKYSEGVAFCSVVTFLTFPTAFFAGAFYSESTFLLLCALIFYFVWGKKYLAASVAVTLASLTRFVGIALAISLFYSYFSQINFRIQKISTQVFTLAVSLFGILIYAVFLFRKLNNPFAFISTQTFWERSANDPASTIVSSLWNIIFSPQRPFDQYFDLIVTITFLAILILGIRKVPSSLWIFSILVILIPISSGTLTSMPRYALSSLGAFVILGQYLKDHPKTRMPLWGSMLLLQALLAVRFINGYWVA